MNFAEMTTLSVSDKYGLPVVVIAGADDEAALRVVAAAGKAGIRFILVGNAESIKSRALGSGVNLDGHKILPTVVSDVLTEADVCGIAAELCASGEAGVLMKGHVGTAAFTRAILSKDSGLTDSGTLLSHVGFFSDPRSKERQAFLLSDGAINIAPDLAAKKKILKNIVAVARSLGCVEPRIAILAPVEKVSSKIVSTTDAEALKVWVKSSALGPAIADGPFALDVAASSDAAALKDLESPVAGQADIYLAPNLEAGNILYKALTVFAGASAAGILAGARVPVVLTSRSDSMEVKLASLGLALRVAAAG